MDVIAADAADETLLLDLLNSTPVVDGEPRDNLENPAFAKTWMRQHDITANRAELAALVDARALLQAVVRGECSPAALRTHLDAVTLKPVATADGIDWQVSTTGAGTGAVRAVLAWDALRITSPGRLRPCANTECQLFLIDRSKPNTARWCSMAICGNRMKARRHYQRGRSASNE
ncbi:CGNR zinc finger domain-containing protein [Mycolicibacterium sp. P9-64]|uniref:CGNR zinc finger domain-containing protein n=1 Tax=Mycolicibacterium sp. P9-64 TaxID=2024612 RepID=UPI0011F0709A|nr:CGNR zinc finger domain-containing protein [Mycolicibacterium sp. P9-64]KAA0075628.1 CGNR zinc finger domain-containing protein [Mycolicibacterium sp. P9-64]